MSRHSSALGGGSVDGGAGHSPDDCGAAGRASLLGWPAAGRMRPGGRIFPLWTVTGVRLAAC